MKKINKQPLKFNLQMLNYFCQYALSENSAIHVGGLTNLRSLLSGINEKLYDNEPALKERYNFVLDVLNVRITKNCNKREFILQDVQGVIGKKYPDINGDDFPELSISDVHWIEETLITKYLNSMFAFEIGDELKTAAIELTTADPSHIQEKADNLINKIKEANVKIRKNEISQDDDNVLDFANPDEAVLRFIEEQRSPSHLLKSGMQALNNVLGGGFEGSRVYCFFGLPGEGKSLLLKNLAIQLKENNKGYKCKDKTKKPEILYLTMENRISEEFATMVNICGYNENLRTSKDSGKDILNYLKDDSPFSVKDGDVSLKMMYKANMSINTSYLYELVEKEADAGYEVICIIQDYLKRIKPVDGNDKDERFRLGNVVNEFKNCAVYYNIPIITASQLNREAAKSVDSARNVENWDRMLDNIGRSNIGESSLIDENLDATFMIAPCDLETGKFLGFKMTKNRYRADIPNKVKKFYQPFYKDSKVRLMEDIHRFKPLCRYSLMVDDLVSPEDNPKTIKERFVNVDKVKAPSISDNEFEKEFSDEFSDTVDTNDEKIELFTVLGPDEKSVDRLNSIKKEWGIE